MREPTVCEMTGWGKQPPDNAAVLRGCALGSSRRVPATAPHLPEDAPTSPSLRVLYLSPTAPARCRPLAR